MGISELLELKAEYERELVFAQAKVSVITDIIAKTQPTEVVEETAEVAEEINIFSVN
jgi:hypothetical protein